MSENSEPRRRGPGKPWQPGVCPNPGGRPKSTLLKSLARILAEKCPGQKFTNEEAICRMMVKAAVNGDKDFSRYIWERMEGKEPQAVDLSSGGAPITFSLKMGGGDAQ